MTLSFLKDAIFLSSQGHLIIVPRIRLFIGLKRSAKFAGQKIDAKNRSTGVKRSTFRWNRFEIDASLVLSLRGRHDGQEPPNDVRHSDAETKPEALTTVSPVEIPVFGASLTLMKLPHFFFFFFPAARYSGNISEELIKEEKWDVSALGWNLIHVFPWRMKVADTTGGNYDVKTIRFVPRRNVTRKLLFLFVIRSIFSTCPESSRVIRRISFLTKESLLTNDDLLILIIVTDKYRLVKLFY